MQKDRYRSFIDAVVKMREMATDEQALEVQAIYPIWKPDVQHTAGERVEYNNRLYKVKQTHTTQADWAPDIALTLFEPIDLVNDGTLDKPITAVIGMTYFKDKYYLDETDGKVYLCTRDDTNGNGTALYHLPSVLVGTYFTAV